MVKRLSNPQVFVSPSQPSAPKPNDVWIDSDEALMGGGFVAQPDAPEDTTVLWYDTDDNTGIATSQTADTVDGIHASTTPEPNKIVSLDANAQMPVSTINFNAIPLAVLATTGTQTVSNTSGVRTAITMSNQVIARGGFTTSSNAITIPETGYYLISANVQVADSENFFSVVTANGVNSVIVQMSFRGTTSTARGYQGSSSSTIVLLTAGGTVQISFENRSYATTINAARLEIMRVG